MSSPIAGMNCANCVYFERIAENHGECRRHAPHPNSAVYVPKVDQVGKIKTDMHWPKVYDNNWCGQFGARKKGQAKPAEEAPKPVRIAVKPPSKPAEGEEVLKLSPEDAAK
jgi:hypothetical protein